MSATTMEILVCVICKNEHNVLATNNETYHKDLIIGMVGMQVVCNTHNYDELVKPVEADCE